MSTTTTSAAIEPGSSRGPRGLIGRIFGSYCLTEIVGRGGMATVFQAEHRVLGRPVALKVLHKHHLGNQTMSRRFVREARMLAQIQHPGVVAILDIGRTSDGYLYTVMELLQGESLQDRLQVGPMSETHALTVSRQIASALSAAHECEIVHRDIKPANIHLVEDAEVLRGERVKVLDFGIAKQTGLTRDDITSAGVAVGTPAYMAPEQCMRDRAVDARTDIYSLGVLMYRMVVGKPPFYATDELEVLRGHLHDPPPPPSERGALISPAFERVILTCLNKQPDQRFQSMHELAEALLELEAQAVATESSGPVRQPAPQPAAPMHLPLIDSERLHQMIPITNPVATSPFKRAQERPIEQHSRLLWSAVGGVALAGAVIAITTLLGYA